MLLVNVSLKFWSLNMAYMLIFLLKKNVSSFCICKSYSHFFSKNTCELDIVLTRTVNILTINELVKLTTLWTTGPCCTCSRWVKGACYYFICFCTSLTFPSSLSSLYVVYPFFSLSLRDTIWPTSVDVSLNKNWNNQNQLKLLTINPI